MEYQLIRSARRTIALQITRGGVLIVRAPLHVPDSAVRRFVREHEDWIERNMARQRTRIDAHPEPPEDEIRRLRALAKQLLPGRVAHFAPLLGVAPTRLTITSAKTRFGSCSGKNAISFSWRLMQYPEAAIDYVVVHELSHILHHDHSPAFYACVARVMPDYKARQELLRQ